MPDLILHNAKLRFELIGVVSTRRRASAKRYNRNAANRRIA
ncbi:hypothetical protein APY04_3141 [Hyphomicrobium sulfonivorans]|uniref:Uncharacterized protein n=1 Tax=Hyphomicrobium sulfonivorans TaxID=121290 RepID=A0A120CTI6_HYPSL|nr:hypothetical protein APY04_3141 [Hyphomicrobium sulfonivorans]